MVLKTLGGNISNASFIVSYSVLVWFLNTSTNWTICIKA